jgi:L-ascorbate metabolism protein UlaG (beta-lactamase superfamily)
MVITWYGEGCFKCQSGEISVLSDPFDAKIGLTPPRSKPNILLKTLAAVPLHESAEAASEGIRDSLIVNSPGEYDAFGVDIKGIPLKKESGASFIKIIYLVDFEGVRFCFLGHLAGELEASDMEEIEYVDVLFIPGGGKPFISQDKAVKLVNKISPKVVIPSFFKIAGLKRPSDDIKDFMKEFGRKAEPQEKFTFKKKDLSEKETELIVLQP